MSITKHPSFAAFGANLEETPPPGENKAIWTFEKSNSARSSTISSVSLNSIFFPLEREEAIQYILSI